MPVTTLDAKTALIVIDVQKGLAGRPLTPSLAEIGAQSARLAGAFRKRGLPVVLVNVTGLPPGRTEQPRHLGPLPDDFAEFIPELDRQPGDLVVTKQTPGAFTRTGLEDLLRGQGVTQLVVTGVATGMGVEATVRQSYELGFNATVVTDAVSDPSAEAQVYCLTQVFPRLGETGSTAEILALLDRRA